MNFDLESKMTVETTVSRTLSMKPLKKICAPGGITMFRLACHLNRMDTCTSDM